MKSTFCNQLALFGLCAVLSSCGTSTVSEPYLPYQLGSPSQFGGTNTDDSPITDTVSFWDGDGVRGKPKIVIDISDQRAYFYKDHHLVGVSKISSGTDGHATPTGTFKITEKDADHKSNLYGEYVYPDGTVAKKDADVTKDPKPPGSKFDGAPMDYFMRFHGGVGICTRDIYLDLLLLTAVCACRNGWHRFTSTM